MPASRPAIACSAAAWSSGSIVVLIFRPPPKTTPGAVAVHELLGQPGREVGLARSPTSGGSMSVLVGQRLAMRLLVLRPRDHPLLEHAREHEVAPALRACRGFSTGSYSDGEAIIPASSAASAGRSTSRAPPRSSGARRPWPSVPSRLVRLVAVAEVGARGGLHAVGAVAEVDGVQVLGEDLLLRPLALEVVGERGLAQLLEDRAVALGRERVLHELLGDRRAALGGAAGAGCPARARGRCPGSPRPRARRSGCPRSRSRRS